MTFRQVSSFTVLIAALLLMASCSNDKEESVKPKTNTTTQVLTKAEALTKEEVNERALDYFAGLKKTGVTIASIGYVNGSFVVKWERPSNCEDGSLYMDSTGKVIKIEARICDATVSKS